MHAYVVEIFTEIGERLTGPGTGTKCARSSPHSEQRRLFSKAVFRDIIVEEQLRDCKLLNLLPPNFPERTSSLFLL